MFKYHLPLADMRGHKGGGGFGFELYPVLLVLVAFKNHNCPSLPALFVYGKQAANYKYSPRG